MGAMQSRADRKAEHVVARLQESGDDVLSLAGLGIQEVGDIYHTALQSLRGTYSFRCRRSAYPASTTWICRATRYRCGRQARSNRSLYR